MKSAMRCLVLALLFMVFGREVMAQRIQGGVILGTNLTQVDGDEVYGFRKLGLNAGLVAIVPFDERWSVSLETLFSQKGANEKVQFDDDSLTGAYDLRLNYLEVPFLVRYTDKDIITAGLGFSWSRLLSATEKENSGNTPPYIDIKGFNDNDINLLADLSFRLHKRLKGNVRYSYSLTSIRKREFLPPQGTDSWKRDQYNNAISFRLIYVFNEKLSKKIQNRQQ